MQNQTSDIHLFNSALSHGNPFAKYDYMHVLPPRIALEQHLNVCDMARQVRQKLPQKFLNSEARAYLAIKNNNCVHHSYEWENAPTDCWYVTVKKEQ